MKCVNCGFESEQEFAFCTQCGSAVQPLETVPVNTAAEKIMSVLKDNLFLAICVLISVSCGLSLINGSLPLLVILATIFLWIVYAKGRKGIVDAETLRSVSGTVFADYVITYVVVGLVVFLGLIVMLLIGAAGEALLLDEIINEFDIMQAEYIDMIELVLSFSAPLLFIIFLLVAVPIFLVNFFGMRKIHGFIKSLYQSAQTGMENIRFVNAAKNWLMVYGILTSISALTSLASDGLAAIAGGCNAALFILASVLIRKYFTSNEF